nr:E3 ubiquitin-protein ligase RNF168-like [Biomphalaria glabrata]
MIVHLEKDKEALSSQLEENWKLIKKIEPFRDVLDNFEMEKNYCWKETNIQKVKYVETLKKIAPVIATAQCDSSKMTQTPGEPRIPFKGKKMLSESECMCPVCISLLIQPVTKRISVWARKAAKENKLINIEKWKDIQEAFPEKVRRSLEASEDEEDDFEAQER